MDQQKLLKLKQTNKKGEPENKTKQKTALKYYGKIPNSPNICVFEIPGNKKELWQAMFKKIIAKNFLKLIKYV